jgi:serine/threonine protein kinase
MLQSFYVEVLNWRLLRHPNIVPFLGISTVPCFSLVTEWMPHGNIGLFLRTRPNENRVEYVRLI